MDLNLQFDTPFFLILFLTGFIFLVAGSILKKYPPKKINALYGYRTKRSMKSQAAWDFAQIRGGEEMVKSGLMMLIFSLLGLILELEEMQALGASIILVITYAVTLFMKVEKALKEKFN